MLVFYTRNALSDIARHHVSCSAELKFFDQWSEREQWKLCLARLAKGDRLFLLMATDLGQNFQEAGHVLKKLLSMGVEVVLLQTGAVFKRQDFALKALNGKSLEVLENGWRAYVKWKRKPSKTSSPKPLGRPKLRTPDNFPAMHRAYLLNEIGLEEASEACGMSTTTFWRRHRDLQ